MARVALYARVSTTDQTLEPQLHALREYSHARGLEIVEEYVDEGVSGARDRRPGLDALLRDAARHRFDAVLIWKLDRLGRSLGHLIRLVDQLGHLGIDLISLNDPGMDTTAPTGKLIFHVMGAVAEFERGLIAQRTKAGLAAAKRRGKRLGRPRAIRGSATFKLERWLAEGRSVRSIASELEVCRATVIAEATRLGLRRSVA